jgi:hypothetical protein
MVPIVPKKCDIIKNGKKMATALMAESRAEKPSSKKSTILPKRPIRSKR